MKSSAVIFAAMAVPMVVVALRIDAGLISLAISSGVALVAMVVGLVLFLKIGEGIPRLKCVGEGGRTWIEQPRPVRLPSSS